MLLVRLRVALRQGQNPADLVETLASALPVADRLVSTLQIFGWSIAQK